MNDPSKKDIKKGGKNAMKLPTNDEPWGPQPVKRTILISDKVERFMQAKGGNDLEVKVMEEWFKK
jgi:hypothetical protein